MYAHTCMQATARVPSSVRLTSLFGNGSLDPSRWDSHDSLSLLYLLSPNIAQPMQRGGWQRQFRPPRRRRIGTSTPQAVRRTVNMSAPGDVPASAREEHRSCPCADRSASPDTAPCPVSLCHVSVCPVSLCHGVCQDQ